MSVPNPAAAQTPPPSKPLWKRWYFWVGVVAVLALLGGIMQALGLTDDDAEAAPSEAVAETPSEDPTPEPSVEPEPEPEPSEAVEPSPTTPSVTTGGLDQFDIGHHCATAAEAQAFPYKIKVHTMLGVKLVQINDDEIRVLYEATVTAPEGGEVTMEVLCVATGTPESVILELVEIR